MRRRGAPTITALRPLLRSTAPMAAKSNGSGSATVRL
jgi:hypothetical protein